MESKYTYTPLLEPIPIKDQNWPEGTIPLVHTRTMTYNHESYIRECIDGILMQKTTFPVQVLIHDDASTDKTSEILKEYEATYPKLIRIFYQKENSYSKPDKHERRKVFMGEWRVGKYEALCEGDDYWTDPLKLQKQVDFLEDNPDFTMSFHAVKILQNPNVSQHYSYPVPKSEFLKFNDILFDHYIPTCSLVFRKSKLPNPLPKWIEKCIMGDIIIELFLANEGKTKYHSEAMGAYRRHDGGITQNKTQKKRGRNSLIIIYLNLRKQFGFNRFLPLTYMLYRTRLGVLKDFMRNR